RRRARVRHRGGTRTGRAAVDDPRAASRTELRCDLPRLESVDGAAARGARRGAVSRPLAPRRYLVERGRTAASRLGPRACHALPPAERAAGPAWVLCTG